MPTPSHAAPPFTLEVASTDSGPAVRVAGRLIAGAGADHPAWSSLAALGGTSVECRRTFHHERPAAGGGPDHVTLDLRAVTAIDARGVGRLLRVRQRLGARGARLTVAAATPRVARVLRLAGLDAVFGLPPGPATRQDLPTGGPVRLLCRCA
jgi:anti-anti-sigma factor